MKSDYMNFDNNDKREKGQRMEDQKQIADSLTAFREADMELDRVYSLFPKACGLSDPEYWSLLLIYEGNVTQMRYQRTAFHEQTDGEFRI